MGSPVGRRVVRHRRTASFRALRAIASISPVRPSERRVERNCIRRDRLTRADARFYRDLLIYCGQPPQPRRRRRIVQPPPVVEAPILVSSDTSAEDLPQPQEQQRPVEVVDLDTSGESLPNIDPRPQHQVPMPFGQVGRQHAPQAGDEVILESTLEDLGDQEITRELLPPLRNQVFREAYVLLTHLVEQQQQQQLLTPPQEPDVDWGGLEQAVANFDNLPPPAPQPEFVVQPQPLALQQPHVILQPNIVPMHYVPPQPMRPVDWGMIVHALFKIAEREHAARLNNPN